MRIACPSCAAEYDVPPSRLKPGKLVRCARCGNDWSPAPEDVAPPQDDAEPPTPEITFEPTESPLGMTAMDRLARSAAASQSRRPGLIAAWVLTFVVLAGAVAAAVAWPDAIIRTWPPSNRILTARTAPQPAQPPALRPAQTPALQSTQTPEKKTE
jgi:predicted Zn finger-like uncharacterized protein